MTLSVAASAKVIFTRPRVYLPIEVPGEQGTSSLYELAYIGRLLLESEENTKGETVYSAQLLKGRLFWWKLNKSSYRFLLNVENTGKKCLGWTRPE